MRKSGEREPYEPEELKELFELGEPYEPGELYELEPGGTPSCVEIQFSCAAPGFSAMCKS